MAPTPPISPQPVLEVIEVDRKSSTCSTERKSSPSSICARCVRACRRLRVRAPSGAASGVAATSAWRCVVVVGDFRYPTPSPPDEQRGALPLNHPTTFPSQPHHHAPPQLHPRHSHTTTRTPPHPLRTPAITLAPTPPISPQPVLEVIEVDRKSSTCSTERKSSPSSICARCVLACVSSSACARTERGGQRSAWRRRAHGGVLLWLVTSLTLPAHRLMSGLRYHHHAPPQL